MHVAVEIEIERPSRDVFDFVSNVENNPLWQRGVSEARRLTESPLGPGSRYEQVSGSAGRPVVTTFEVTDIQPGRSITIESVESPYPIKVTRRVAPIDDGRSLVSVDIESEPGGMMRIFRPLIRRFARNSINQDYLRLKEFLEQA